MRRTLRPYEVYGFESTHEALEAERMFDAAGLDSVTIPAPSTLSARCGIALRIPPEQAGRAEECLVAAGIRPVARITIQDL